MRQNCEQFNTFHNLFFSIIVKNVGPIKNTFIELYLTLKVIYISTHKIENINLQSFFKLPISEIIREYKLI